MRHQIKKHKSSFSERLVGYGQELLVSCTLLAMFIVAAVAPGHSTSPEGRAQELGVALSAIGIKAAHESRTQQESRN